MVTSFIYLYTCIFTISLQWFVKYNFTWFYILFYVMNFMLQFQKRWRRRTLKHALVLKILNKTIHHDDTSCCRTFAFITLIIWTNWILRDNFLSFLSLAIKIELESDDGLSTWTIVLFELIIPFYDVYIIHIIKVIISFTLLS